MLKYLIAYLGTGVSIATLDAAYLTLAGQKVYRPTLDYALADKPALPAAIVFYLVYVLGVVLLAILPNRDAGLGKTALTGAILGAFAYATYDLTNQATLKVWATRITVIDICWGTFLTFVGASAGYLAWRWAAKTFG
ncbi:MAG TPA: DUF2177 family protein [Phenylobacterium sp.]|jgi:uncharacterized membrane protein|uniref:DUF2177 family protein n=1 Tax=Phenylobacterium sp. TaxID=1871053 RepID=UPI002D028888|nr:DUF2177 family protein [Phenylobacterium sp.]HXA39290.1 DUF2177 family protein [Phenylobacterium sp.]